MKKLPLIINAVLAIAVIILYILHFTSPSNKTVSSGNDTLKTGSLSTGGIVYINIDSVYANYQMYKDVVGDLQSKYNASDAQLKAKQAAFEKNVNDYKYKIDRGLMTRSETAQNNRVIVPIHS